MRYSFENLSEFIALLEKENELIRIKEPVSANLEITEFYLREQAKGEAGKALLFENVDGKSIPVLINSMGSFKRLKLAFGGLSPDELSAELAKFLDLEFPSGFSEVLSKAKQFAGARKFLPKKVKKAACQEIVYTGNQIDLNQFPILKTWPDDGGPFITLPLVFTKNLFGKAKNCGMYRMQIYDKKTTGMHWQIHHDGSNFYSEYRKASKRMEVAVAIGSDPALPFAAIAPLPPKIFEMLIAGFIRNKPVEMVRCKTVDIEVPAQAEIILEGYVEPDELRSEGPFGDHTGYYTLEEDYPVFHLTAITTRKNPVYMTTVVGRSPQEDCYFGGKATERIFLPMFKTIAHEVTDMLLPWDGCFQKSIPVLINSMGSFKRLKLAFGGLSPDELSAELAKFLDLEFPSGFSEVLSKAKQFAGARKFLPKKVKKAACQEIVYTGNQIDLNQFPILKTWPDDGGPFITLPLVFTKNLFGKAKNCGMYRMQIYDKKTTGMHWQIHHDGSNFYSEYRKASKRMEVAVAIGSDPALPFAAIAPLPPKIFEMLIAGFIRNKPVEMVRCKTVDIEVPAQAEIILEGYVEPDELRSEGPFGDHTGYYTLEEDYPVFHLTAITTRKNPVYMTTVVGRSPQEDCYFGGKATERIFLPMFKTIAHEVTDMLLPWDGCFHNCMIVSMKKNFPQHARKLMSQIWGTGQASTCKAIIVVDDGVTLSDSEAILIYILERLDIKHGVVLNEGVVDALDHSSYQWAYGGKIGLDITSQILSESHQSDAISNNQISVTQSELITQLQSINKLVLQCRLFAGHTKNPVLIIKVDKKQGKLVEQISAKIFDSELFNDFNIFFFVDEKNDLEDGHQLIWRLTNNTDWKEDTYFSPDRKRLAIDSTSKLAEDGFNRRWPDDLLMTDEIKKRVDEKSKQIQGLH